MVHFRTRHTQEGVHLDVSKFQERTPEGPAICVRPLALDLGRMRQGARPSLGCRGHWGSGQSLGRGRIAFCD